MTDLLRANFSRLLKSKPFFLGIFFMAGLGAFTPLMSYMDMVNSDYTLTLDNSLFSYPVFTVIVTAVFCSLFVGTEFSDGTIRNKLVVGKTRFAVYFSSLIVCSVACLLIQLTYIVITLLVGVPLLGLELAVPHMLLLMFCALLVSWAFISLFTLVAMTSHSKALTAIICILGTFLCLFIGLYINSSLNEPPTYSAYSYTDSTGTHSEQEKPNPHYLTGTKRTVYEYLYDALPGCQAIQLTTDSVARPSRIMAFAAVFIVLPACAGAVVFKKRDIN